MNLTDNKRYYVMPYTAHQFRTTTTFLHIKHATSTQCCTNVGEPSTMLAQHWSLVYEECSDTKDPVQQDDQLTDFTIQMRVIHCAVLSPFNGSWNYALASVSSYKTSDNFTTLASK